MAGERQPAALHFALAPMSTEIPQFGEFLPEVDYLLRPGGYTVLCRQSADSGTVVGLVRTTIATPQGSFLRYFLPGGGQHAGESPDQAAVREAREETGLQVRLLQEIGLADELVYGAEEQVYFRKRCTFFLAEVVHQAGTGEADHELVWLPIAEAVKLLSHVSQRWALNQATREA